ncbi:MAG TPA: pyridoxal-phosphate dependent enzyme, partial [Blastocatellia bacterium]|nr:pyridoxal-phosphate dependent enzyme [Blastocatellia bacterium]
AIRDSAGRGVKVSDDEIISGIVDLARSTGVFVEPAAAAAFAGFVKMSQGGEIKSDERVLLMLTGNGLKDIDSARRRIPDPLRVQPDLDSIAECGLGIADW